MKLPDDMPFILLDKNLYGNQVVAKLTEDFVEWIVRDCARVCRDMPFAELDQFPDLRNDFDLCAALILRRYGLE